MADPRVPTPMARPEQGPSIHSRNASNKINEPRKPISETRRQQNKAAQKAYRDRKKKRFRELEQLVNSNSTGFILELEQIGNSSSQEGHGTITASPTQEASYDLPIIGGNIPTAYPTPNDEALAAQRTTENLDVWTFGDGNFAMENATLENASQRSPSLERLQEDSGMPRNVSYSSFTGLLDESYETGLDGLDFTGQSGPHTTDHSSGSSSSTNPQRAHSELGRTYQSPPSTYFIPYPRDATLEMAPGDEIAEPRPVSPGVILIYRPSGPLNKIAPANIRRYFRELPGPLRQRLETMARDQQFDFVDIICAGIANLTRGSWASSHIPQGRFGTNSTSHLSDPTSLQKHNSSALSRAAGFNPYANNLRIGRISYFASIFMNASGLGFDFWHYLDEDSTSPLYEPNQIEASESELQALLATKYAGVPKDLKPVGAQITKKHHPYLDVLPFPMFRQRAIAAATTDPPLLDEDDLCIDLMLNDGLVCWGSPGGHTSMDMGTPWDMRSWEAKPWFLKKWWWLVGDKDDVMWSGARWWHMMRRVNG